MLPTLATKKLQPSLRHARSTHSGGSALASRHCAISSDRTLVLHAARYPERRLLCGPKPLYCSTPLPVVPEEAAGPLHSMAIIAMPTNTKIRMRFSDDRDELRPCAADRPLKWEYNVLLRANDAASIGRWAWHVETDGLIMDEQVCALRRIKTCRGASSNACPARYIPQTATVSGRPSTPRVH